MLKIIKDNITKQKKGQHSMKNYQSTQEGSWIELLKVELTEEEKAVMSSTSMEAADAEARRTLMAEIKAKREGSVASAKVAELQAFYESKKPEVPEGQTYQLIAMDISEGDSGFTGILNCRVNGEHVQVRF
jgi:hypothetical protein